MDLQSVIQSEVRKRKTYIVYLGMESRKIILMNLFARQEETDIENRCVDAAKEGEGGMN